MAKVNSGRRIALIGAMGSGKSSLARRYIKKYGGTGFDTDAEFTRRYGPISEFFASKGEAEFRKLEQELLVEAADSDASVIATGGGAVLGKIGMNALRSTCDIVYLTAPYEILENRIRASARPLKNDLANVLKAREHLYNKYADYIVDSSYDSLSELERVFEQPRRNRYDTVLCDSDDTILDFGMAMSKAIVNAARAVGVSKSEDEIISAYKTVLPVVWGQLERGEITRAELEIARFEMLKEMLEESFDPIEMNNAYVAEMCKTRDVRDGAIDFLRALRARGVKVYIVTNSFTCMAEKRLEAVAPYIDGAFVSEEIGYNKPDPRFFEKVSESVGGLDKQRTIVFGDSVTSDIAGGIAFGVDTCLYDPTGQKRSTADFTASCYTEFLNLL